jgi:salicylate hydroxylase
MKIAMLVAALASHDYNPRTSPKPARNIAVIGSGIAGLATAHALYNQDESLQISIYDDRPGLDQNVGAGIQLNGGLAVLGKINPALQQAVMQAGAAMEKVQSRAKPWNPIKNEYDTLLELSLKEIVIKEGYKELMLDDQVLWTSIMRGALQQTLYEQLPPSLKVGFNKRLVDLEPKKNGVNCCFADGSKSGPFDLVIGCDGIKSAVKEYIDKGQISHDSSKREGAAAGLYTGIRIRYAVYKEKSQSRKPVTLTQYFGDGCYCLDGEYGAGVGDRAKSAFVIFLDPDYFGPFRKNRIEASAQVQENADWKQDKQEKLEVARTIMRKQLEDGGIPDRQLAPTIEKADRFFELGVYAHNPFCKWSKHVKGTDGAFVVLCGDAAHALPPFLGQGSNQAVQDAFCLATKICTYNKQVSLSSDGSDEKVRTLGAFLEEYESVRWMPNFQIFWKAAFLGYLETGGFGGAYSKFRDVFFKTMGAIGVAQKILLSAATPKV